MLKHLRTVTPIVAGLIVLSFGIFFGEWLGLYKNIPYLDKVFHLLGGVAAAWFVLALLQNDITHMAAWKQVLILVAITALIGVVWEWAEFASSYIQYSHPTWYRYFSGGDVADTLGDLVYDSVGALILSFWALRKERSE